MSFDRALRRLSLDPDRSSLTPYVFDGPSPVENDSIVDVPSFSEGVQRLNGFRFWCRPLDRAEVRGSSADGRRRKGFGISSFDWSSVLLSRK